MTGIRRLGIALTPLLALVALSAVAFACTALATLSPSETSGPAGSKVEITGKQLEPLPIELHWNSVSGPVLGTAQGPAFSTAVTIPATASANGYYIFAVQHHADGTINKIPTAFQVTSGPGAPAAHAVDRAVQPSGGTPVALVAGVAALSVGLIGLASGFTAVTVRRRRALAGSHLTTRD